MKILFIAKWKKGTVDRVLKVEMGVELEQDRWCEGSFAMREVGHRLFQTFYSQFDVNVVESHVAVMQPSQGAQITVNGVMRFNGKADQGNEGGDCIRSGRKRWKTVKMAELDVGVLNGLVLPLGGG